MASSNTTAYTPSVPKSMADNAARLPAATHATSPCRSGNRLPFIVSLGV
jgi:hypothetical protein